MDLTRTAIMMTAWRRPQYLRQTLASWAKVDGVRDVAAFRVCLDPSDRLEKMLAVIAEARSEHGLDIHRPRQHPPPRRLRQSRRVRHRRASASTPTWTTW